MKNYHALATASMVVIVLSLVAGCVGQHEPPRADVDGQREASRADVGVQSTPVSITVALLGDRSRVDLLKSIASTLGVDCKTVGESVAADVNQGERAFRFRATRDETTVAQARLAWEADLVLLAVDAADGPMPVHREHSILARQMAVPDVAVAFTNSQLIDDSELLELEELEVRELLNNYELPGDDALCVFDHAEARTSAGDKYATGPLQIVNSLAIVARRRPSEGSSREAKRLSSVVYSLGRPEVDPPEIATMVQSGPTTVLMRGELFAAKIVTSADISPGSVGEVDIVFEEPAQIAAVQRFALLNKGHISAVGVFTSDPNR